MSDGNAENRDSQEQATEENIEKPGVLLKAAREREGLSVDEVAKSLYLTRSKLKALENDEYEKLQSHVFIRGYLRKYAPLVGLDGEKLVDRFDKIYQQISQTLEDLEDKDEDIPRTLVPKFIVPAALFGVAAVVVITIFVFIGDRDSPVDTTITPASEIDSELAQRIAARAERADQSDVAKEQPNLDRELAAEALELAATQQAANLDTNETANQTVRSENPTANSTAPAVNSTLNAVDGPELRFEFSEDCWLEVRDQFDQILYTDVARAGESLELQGEPPFAISLGNAQAVTLYWGDEEIDTQPRPGRRTNKLVVGDEVTTR